MWIQVIAIISVVLPCLAEITAPGIDRTISDGVTSVGYKIVYGDEYMSVINEIVNEVDKNVLKEKSHLNELIKPLAAEDVKCLMSVDRYCSKKMGEMKSVLIQAVRDDCSQCTTEQKEGAGKVVAAMMAHDPVAWKLFLTRYDGLPKIQRILG